MNSVELFNLQDWFNYKRKRFWTLVLILLYTMLGFFAIPAAIKNQLPAIVQGKINRNASVKTVEFNPWTLHLRAHDFVLLDTDGSTLARFDELSLNLQLRSIFKLALVLKEATLAKPAITIVRYKSADSNIGKLLAEMDATTAGVPETEQESQNSKLFRFVIDKLEIENGTIQLRDEMPETVFSTLLAPVNVEVSNLSTLPNASGNHQVNVTTENGARLTFLGSLTLNPLNSDGQLEFVGSPVQLIYRYLQDQLNFAVDDGSFEFSFNYRVSALPDGGISAELNKLSASLRELAVKDASTAAAMFALPEIKFSDGALHWPEQTLSLGTVSLSNPDINVWVNEDGSSSVDNLLIDEKRELETNEQAADTAAPWNVELNELRIDGLAVKLEDRSLREPGQISFPDTTIRITGISTSSGSQWPLAMQAVLPDAGNLEINGTMGIDPEVTLQADVGMQGLSVAAAQPWVVERATINIESGLVGMTGQLNLNNTAGMVIAADIDVQDLQVSDALTDEPLIGWTQLALQQTNLQLLSNKLEISRVTLAQPFLRIILAEDGSNNFTSLMFEEAAPEVDGSTAAEAKAAEPFIVRIAETKITDGSMDFADNNLPLPFRVLISEFSGELSALATDSSEASKVAMEGKIGDYGQLTLDGSLNVLQPTDQSDIMLAFRNVNMPDLSPYTANFAGRKIDAGTLDLDLNYTFAAGKMQGSNKMVLTQIELGDKVENPDAMRLPLDLAVALLKDVNGVIDMDFSVSGDVNDPAFSASGIILKAFANLIMKVATSPFILLGGLVPGGDEVSLDSIEFAAGLAEIAPPEREKLAQLTAALAQRPNLKLSVPGAYNPAADGPALQAVAVDTQLAALIDADENNNAQLLVRTRMGLEKLAKQQLEDFSANTLQQEFKRPNSEPGAMGFDEVAYIDTVRKQLEAAQPINDAELM